MQKKEVTIDRRRFLQVILLKPLFCLMGSLGKQSWVFRQLGHQGHDGQGTRMGAECDTSCGLHQLSWAFARLLVICVSPVYQVVDEFSPCVLWPFMTGLMAVLQTFFSYGFTYEGLMLFKGMDIEFKDNYVGILQENEM